MPSPFMHPLASRTPPCMPCAREGSRAHLPLILGLQEGGQVHGAPEGKHHEVCALGDGGTGDDAAVAVGQLREEVEVGVHVAAACAQPVYQRIR